MERRGRSYNGRMSRSPCLWRSALAPVLMLMLALSACHHAPSSPPPTAEPRGAFETEELAQVGISLRELSPGVFLAVHQSPNQSSANILVVHMRDGSLVICSSPYDTGTTRALVRHLRARFAPPRIVAINTHFHADGTAGNGGYAAEGVETYASDQTVALQMERGVQGLEGMARYIEAEDPALADHIRATRVVAARHVFPQAEGLTLMFGGEPMQALFVGGGHSPDNVVVHFPKRGVLFGGCMGCGELLLRLEVRAARAGNLATPASAWRARAPAACAATRSPRHRSPLDSRWR